MKIIITGITGFVGSHLADFLINDCPEVEVHGVKRYHLSRTDNIEHFYEKVIWHDCNLLEATSVNELIKSVSPDIIFHMAAESFVSPSWRHPQNYMFSNYGMTVNLLEAIKNFSPNSVIHLPGSGEEYGDISVDQLPINNDTKLNPVNPYAVTKIAQDLIGYVYFRSYGLKVIRTRAFNHEGPRRHFVFGIPSYAWQIARIEHGLQKPIIETGDVDDRRNFTDVRDMVRAYWLSTLYCEPGKLYLVGQDDENMVMTFREGIDMLIEISNLNKNDISVKQVEKYTRPTNVPFLISDVTEFREKTGWKCRFSLNDILTDTLDYWRERVANGKY